jgi:hypothetical protein
MENSYRQPGGCKLGDEKRFSDTVERKSFQK